jgi:hypothetical protein
MPAQSSDWSVSIDIRGRAGNVTYREGRNSLELYWEMGGGRAMAYVSGPSPQDWDRSVPWASGRREQVMRRVAAEVVRQSAPRSDAEFGDDFSTILITMPTRSR